MPERLRHRQLIWVDIWTRYKVCEPGCNCVSLWVNIMLERAKDKAIPPLLVFNYGDRLKYLKNGELPARQVIFSPITLDKRPRASGGAERRTPTRIPRHGCLSLRARATERKRTIYGQTIVHNGSPGRPKSRLGLRDDLHRMR